MRIQKEITIKKNIDSEVKKWFIKIAVLQKKLIKIFKRKTQKVVKIFYNKMTALDTRQRTQNKWKLSGRKKYGNFRSGTFTEIKTKQKTEIFERLCDRAPCMPGYITAVPGLLKSSGQLERKMKLLRRGENQFSDFSQS